MAREVANQVPRARAGAEVATFGDVAIVTIAGLVDEQFRGFGQFGDATKSLVINVSGMTRMTSFGVRQWLKGMDALPKTITDVYLLGCPTFFVDQLNMVLNFGGPAQVLTVVAPYTCPSCGVESGELIDVLADRAALAKGGTPEKECARCGAKLEFDETPESYFSFVNKYAAASLSPSVAGVLAQQNLYTATEVGNEKPPRIIKLVHGIVTYFRIIGNIGAMFRARPFLVGAEGEVVIDLAEVEKFEEVGRSEWRRLMKTLAGQVPAVTIVDVDATFLSLAGESIALARNIAVYSLRVPYVCEECGRRSSDSYVLEGKSWPFAFEDHVCSTCGGATHASVSSDVFAPIVKSSNHAPPASSKVIQTREEILSRALTDASVAQASDNATASLNADTILGKYKIVRRLSEGGMAEVFLAKQVGIGGFEKPVALKRIQRQLLEARHLAIDMFLNEAKIAGRLIHPNIVQVLDVGEVNGALYLAMEYVRGKDLREVVKQVRAQRVSFPIGDACMIVREIALALHHAYWSTDLVGNRLAVVHRDVSPHNVIISFDGAVKLLDFGVAMSAVTEQNDLIVGKSMYMSPEHTTNQNVDHRSDIFSLGVILYLLCTNQMPFPGVDSTDTIARVRSGKFIPPIEHQPYLPPALNELICSMLAHNPEQRPQTGRQVVAALTEVIRDRGLQTSPSSLAAFLGQLFPAERDDTAPLEIRRTSQEMETVRPPEPDPTMRSSRISATLLATPSPVTPTPSVPTPVVQQIQQSGPQQVQVTFQPTTPPPYQRAQTTTLPPPPPLPVYTPPPQVSQVSAMSMKSVLVIVAVIVVAITIFILVRPS